MQKLVKIIIVSLFCFFLSPLLSKASSHKDGIEKMSRKELKAEVDSIKARKLSFKDFKDAYAIDDTSDVIIAIFFDKKSNSARGQMSYLPLTLLLAVIPPPVRIIGVGLTVVALPLFINGAYTMYKFRNKKLLMVLTEYKKTGHLPGWVRRKAANMLAYYEDVKLDY
jgi:hypothetical protein